MNKPEKLVINEFNFNPKLIILVLVLLLSGCCNEREKTYIEKDIEFKKLIFECIYYCSNANLALEQCKEKCTTVKGGD